MWNEPTPQELAEIPPLYSNEDASLVERIIHMHFFLNGSDWFASEYCPRRRMFFGYAILNNDLENAEWGYFSLDEMRKVKTQYGFQIDRDLYWTPKPAPSVDKIRQSYIAQGVFPEL